MSPTSSHSKSDNQAVGLFHFYSKYVFLYFFYQSKTGSFKKNYLKNIQKIYLKNQWSIRFFLSSSIRFLGSATLAVVVLRGLEMGFPWKG